LIIVWGGKWGLAESGRRLIQIIVWTPSVPPAQHERIGMLEWNGSGENGCHLAVRLCTLAPIR
jgi:hypothetical protein